MEIAVAIALVVIVFTAFAKEHQDVMTVTNNNDDDDDDGAATITSRQSSLRRTNLFDDDDIDVGLGVSPITVDASSSRFSDRTYSWSSCDSGLSINPASGLPMMGACFDMAGNAYGFGSSFDSFGSGIGSNFDSFGSSSFGSGFGASSWD